MSEQALPTATSRDVWSALGGLWRRNRGRLVLIVVLFGAAAIAALAPPRLFGVLVDALGREATAADIALLCCAMLASVVVQAALLLAATRTALVLGEDVFRDVRDEFMRNALRLPIGVIERGGTGELVTRTTQDIRALGGTVRDAIPQALIAAVTVTLTVVAALLVAPPVVPVYLLALPLLVVVMRWYVRLAPRVYRHLGESYGPMFASVHETASGARTVESLGLQEARNRSMDESIAAHWVTALARIRLRQVMLPWSNLAFAIPVFASLAWGGWLAIEGHMSIGAVVTVTLYASALVAPMETLIGCTDELQRGFVSFARVLGVGRMPDPEAPADRAPRERGAAGSLTASETVELRDVCFSYRAGREVLHGVTLRVVDGERLAVVGPSGAGKSTLARLIAGLDHPSSGTVTVGGVDITGLDPARRRQAALLVTQESHIFATSIRDNVLLARPDADDRSLRAALDTVGASGWIDAFDEGWHTEVGVGGQPLTGAQEQQLALARVVLADPGTIVLDEATSAMDPRAARDLESALAAALSGRTVIAIAHRLSTAHDADRIAVVDGGRLVALGAHERLLADGGAYAELWAAWSDDGGAADCDGNEASHAQETDRSPS
ncbi:ABC-type multidrug transport system fused ATPase/permease subunit [Microbacterium natoriense]|uniref:ABC-type multidrug transport system fused ATPase/permease subunit n=1 Tax=Microbacterium natoriense TaxID=284570 RepID=A0AAW8ET16_9MICO|nr:ABC transporter ATP-binding protein [Microbacterium natoriense]MDQ0645995.1 ABC-type multidrug transport system fused ATPase/permease subunit [Microbacterium natoriense]